MQDPCAGCRDDFEFGIAEDRRYLWKIVAGGMVAFAVGQGLAAAYAGATGSRSDRVIGAIPIAGPMVVAGLDRPTGGWASALSFSSFLQAAGVIVAAVAGQQLADLRVEPRLFLSRGGGSLDLLTRF